MIPDLPRSIALAHGREVPSGQIGVMAATLGVSGLVGAARHRAWRAALSDVGAGLIR